MAGAPCCQPEERGGSLRGAGPVCRGAGEGNPGSRDVCLRNCQSLWSLSVHLVGRLASGPVGVVPRSPGGVRCSPGTPGVLGGRRRGRHPPEGLGDARCSRPPGSCRPRRLPGGEAVCRRRGGRGHVALGASRQGLAARAAEGSNNAVCNFPRGPSRP